jgi:hypothetical protein
MLHPVHLLEVDSLPAGSSIHPLPSNGRISCMDWNSFSRAPHRMGSLCGMLMCLTMLPGCGGGSATVSGQVVYNGKPVTGGYVRFRPANSRGNAITAVIEPSGNYKALNVPTGEAKISVDNRELEPVPAAAHPRPKLPSGAEQIARGGPEPQDLPKKMPGTYVQIPPRYYSDDTAGLSYTVKSGTQTFKIELTDSK